MPTGRPAANHQPENAFLRPLRICILADNASARFGGEAILPLHYFRLLRQRDIEAWLVVHTRVRAELEALLPGELPRMRFIPDTALHRLLFRLSRFLPRRIAESTLGLLNTLLTQAAQRRVARRLAKTHGIDIFHQPTPVSPRFPSLLFNLGAPLVIGPMNGGMAYPPAFRSEDSFASRTFLAVAQRLTELGNAVLPGKRKAALLLVANARTAAALPRNCGKRAKLLVENGVDLSLWRPADTSEPVLPHAEAGRFVFIGRLVNWKALHIALEALAHVPGARLDVIGDGAMFTSWRRLATELGLDERVRFLGWLPQTECAAHLRAATALLLPSLFECGGAVVLEAMAMRRPVIATAWGGPVDYLDSSCGILVAPTSHDALVAGFAEGMQRLLDDSTLCEQMGAAAELRILQHFTWEKKMDAILRLYAEVTAARGLQQDEGGVPLACHPLESPAE